MLLTDEYSVCALSSHNFTHICPNTSENLTHIEWRRITVLKTEKLAKKYKKFTNSSSFMIANHIYSVLESLCDLHKKMEYLNESLKSSNWKSEPIHEREK